VVEQLHDVRPPVPFDPYWRPVDYAVVAGAALLILALALLVIRARRRPEEEPQPPLGPPAHQVALEKLQALRARQLYGSGRDGHLILAGEVPKVLKEYLDEAHGPEYVYRTTRETHRGLSEGYPSELVQRATWLLLVCDRVKFAGKPGFDNDPIDEAEDIVRGLHHSEARGESP
jgi:hypothetical protein